MLSVRIVTSDHSMDDPIPGLDVTYSSFRGSVVKKVPVIRIFGPDSAGVKTCLHIHGVFPYIFIPCVEAEPDGKMQYQLASSLDLALNISLGQTASTSQHVFKVVLVSGTPFYGYHQTFHQYYKIFFYNPHMVKKASELLQSGAILNNVYQVHHCHIPYNLQFFIDYNLRGMDYISLEAVKYRRHPSNCLTPEWASEDMLLPAHISRLSVSEVEADGMADDIMNVRTMSLTMNPGLADIWDDEKQRRREEFRSSQITPPSSQQRPDCASTDSEIFFKKRIQENLRFISSQRQESSVPVMDNSANINSSIPYPVEVPEGATLINASYLDSHVVSSCAIPSNTQCSNLNESFVDESLVLSLLPESQKRSPNDSVLLDSQDMMFAEVLGELHEDQVRVDDDSILGSQLEKECAEDDADFLSGNHEIVNTILEENAQINSDETASKQTRQMWQESFWSGVDANCVVPQLDGTLESPDSTPGTSTSETQPLLDLVQPPNYWPFPELAALEPCNEGIHNGNCEPCEEDLMDLSFSTATYSNISEPYNRVLLGDPAFTLPPSATPSELGDCVQIPHEFGNNDQHFEGELMENLNFPDIGEFLEPSPDSSSMKDIRPFYIAEMNGSPAKNILSKTGVKRKHSKANKAIPMNGTLGEQAADCSSTVGTDIVFQQPQQPMPCTNSGYYYQPIPPSTTADGKTPKKAKMAKKVSSKRKSCTTPLIPEAAENDLHTLQDDAAVAPVKKVSAKKKTTFTPCEGATCYAECIDKAIIRAMGELENAECISQLESNLTLPLPESNATNTNAPPQKFVETPCTLAPANGTNAASYDNAINNVVHCGMSECIKKDATLANGLDEGNPLSSISTIPFHSSNKILMQEKLPNQNANKTPTEEKHNIGLNNIGSDIIPNHLANKTPMKGKHIGHKNAGIDKIPNHLANKTPAEGKQTGLNNAGSDIILNHLANKTPTEVNPDGLGIERSEISTIPNQLANKVPTKVNPAGPNTMTTERRINVCKQPSLVAGSKNSTNNALLNKSLPSISITSVKRNQVVSEPTRFEDPSVLRTKSLPGISLTVSKKKSVLPNTSPKIKSNNVPDTYSMVAIGNQKTTSVPKMLPMRPPISSLSSTSVVERMNSKCPPTSAMKMHVRSPLALVRREDDLTLAQLIKLEKTKEISSPQGKSNEEISLPPKCVGSQDSEDEFEIAVSKNSSLVVERNDSFEVLGQNCLPENNANFEVLGNICRFEERSTLTIKDISSNQSGIDCCLKLAKSSANSISLAELISRVTDAYNSPNPMKLTISKDMCKRKFHFESIEIQAVNSHTYKTPPESDSGILKTVPVSSTSKVTKKKCALPKITLKRNNHKQPSSKHLGNNRQKAPLTLTSHEIKDSRCIAIFETRTGQTMDRAVQVVLERLSEEVLRKYFVKRAPKQFKIPCVDGGVDSDMSSSDDDSVARSEPSTPKRRKGRYRPLAVQFEKSPKSETSKSVASVVSPGKAALRKNRPKRGSYGALDVKFDKSPSSKWPSQGTASSSSLGIQPNASKHTEHFPPDSTVKRLLSDDQEATICKISQSNCDDTIKSVQCETGCDQNIFNEDSASKKAKKKLTFPLLSMNQEMYETNVASNFLETNMSVTFPARRSSFDIFEESDSPRMFPCSGDTASESLAQTPIDTVESIGALELISDDEINDLGIVSFYDNTHIFTSPSDTTFNGSPESSDIVSSGDAPITKLPNLVRESKNSVEPEVHHQEPFYSNPADVTVGIQVGHRIVKLLCGPSQIPQNQKPAPVRPGKVTITLCQRPPSYAEVERWTKAKKLLKEQDVDIKAVKKPGETNSPSSQGMTEESLVKASVSPVTESSSSPKINQLEFSSATSTPQKTRRMRMISPTYTPIVDIKAKLRNSKRKSLVTSSFKLREPSIEEVDESGSPTEPMERSPKPSTSRETQRRVAQRRRSSVHSIEDPSLHKLLLQSQFRQQLASPRRLSSGCQIEGVQNNTFGFGMSLENLQDAKALTRHQHLSVMSMELHLQTRGDLRPDPAHDPIRAVFYYVVNDVPDSSLTPKQESGALAVCDSDDFLTGCGLEGRVRGVSSEHELIDEVVMLVRRTDPDIFCGYETEMLSWGYLIQRAATLQINLCPLLSRIPTMQREYRRDNDEADGAIDGPTHLRLPGRVLLNVWRLMKSEIALMNYSFENVMFHVLHQRVPLHSFRSLSHWWEHPSKRFRWLTAEYYETHVRGMVRIMDQLDLIGRTSELARLFGIQFYEVFSRGSQFRVESMMLRLAKPLNYVPVSPSIHQRAQMRAPECVPLIMEPESAFYADPVIVLDFQSLYPSIIIAYNYCYSTCLGRVEHLGKSEPFAFGCTSLKVPPRLVKKLSDKMNVSPNGVAFVQTAVRRGVLPRMLQEILETRLMVKKSMKEHAEDKTLQRVLHSRQLGLKLIANVTYGYTSANFSGRMPCIEIGDSVVSKGRETLERAIRLVHQTERWRAKVVYGDTDSLFVLVKGRSREQAFAIGAEIADAVTRDNPKPVKLKLEKVYHPCILQTKKRYVGYLYESPDQGEPKFDAKGIETVRRDGCPAVAKMLEKCLRLLFETRDASLVKRYVCRQFDKLLRGRANVHDLVFAREYRGMAGYKPGACVPALELTRRWIRADRRSEPRVGERVPYVIVAGAPGLPLIRLVRSPHELFADPSLRVNAIYYVTRAIVPALNRCLLLIGADALSWFSAMPRKAVSYLPMCVPTGLKKSTISQYFATTDCAACSRPTRTGLCTNCAACPQATVLALNDKVRLWERNHARITQVCESCVGRSYSIDCMSLDCPVMFRKYQAFRDLEQAPFVRQLIDQF